MKAEMAPGLINLKRYEKSTQDYRVLASVGADSVLFADASDDYHYISEQLPKRRLINTGVTTITHTGFLALLAILAALVFVSILFIQLPILKWILALGAALFALVPLSQIKQNAVVFDFDGGKRKTVAGIGNQAEAERFVTEVNKHLSAIKNSSRDIQDFTRRLDEGEIAFENLNLVGFDFGPHNIQHVVFERCCLDLSRFAGNTIHTMNSCSAKGARFQGCTFKNSFRNADFTDAKFQNCTISAANFPNANFSNATFASKAVLAKLGGASFEQASLVGSGFLGCDLRDACFPKDAIPGSKDQTDKKKIQAVSFLGSFCNTNTVLPVNIDREADLVITLPAAIDDLSMLDKQILHMLFDEQGNLPPANAEKLGQILDDRAFDDPAIARLIQARIS